MVNHLRRADGLLTPKGFPVKELADESTEDSRPSASSGTRKHRKHNSLSLAGDLLQRFKDVSASVALGRSRSFTARTNKQKHETHYKAPRIDTDSDLPVRPLPPRHAISEPTPMSTTAKAGVEHVYILESGGNDQQLASIKEEQHQAPPQTPTFVDIHVPDDLQTGTWMTKVSGKKQKKVFLRLDADMGHIVWEARKQPRIIPIENIKEIRSGMSTRLHRAHFQLAQTYESLWLTIIYILDGRYKILHLIAPSEDLLRIWDTTLRKLFSVRQQLMTGLGNIEMRQRVWERQYWKGADVEGDQKLTFEDVEKLCRRLNINTGRDDLYSLFKEADLQSRGFLDFEDFRRFVKLLKTRSEITKLYHKLKGINESFDFIVFERFMREEQKSKLSKESLQLLFEKYSVPVSSRPTPPPSPMSAFPFSSSPDSRTLTPATLTSFLMSSDNSAFPPPQTVTHDMTLPLSSYYISSSHNTYLVGHQFVGSASVEGYVRALLQGCRSVEIDVYDGSGSSSSPAAVPAVVGSQGVTNELPSTPPSSDLLATLQPASSSSPDAITPEPLIFHGRTLTSKVPLRQVCQAIMKYGFVASPYPIIISAENHCSFAGQESMVRVMTEEFGAALVKYPGDGPDLNSEAHGEREGRNGRGWKGKAKIERLPSPEELKGRILLKTKNLTLNRPNPISTSTTMSTDSDTDHSSSASEGELTYAYNTVRQAREGGAISSKKKSKEGDIVRDGFMRASSVLQRVRSVGRPGGNSSSPSTSRNISSRSQSPPGISSSPIFSSSLSSSPPPMSTPIFHYIEGSKSKTELKSKNSGAPDPQSTDLSGTSNHSTPVGPVSPVGSVSMSLPQLNSPIEKTSNVAVPGSGLVRNHSQNLGPVRDGGSTQKPKMSMALVALLVYTVGVKYRGLRSIESFKFGSSVELPDSQSQAKGKEKSLDASSQSTNVAEWMVETIEADPYAPEHVFSLSENRANKLLRSGGTGMLSLIMHTAQHLVRVYPRGTRMSSTNFSPLGYWSAGVQLVAINWQTIDFGFVLNHAMFQRNGRCGYVLKPAPLRLPYTAEYVPTKWRRTSHILNVTIISAQQLPRVKVKDGSGHEVLETSNGGVASSPAVIGNATAGIGVGGGASNEGSSNSVSVDPYVEVSIHVPEWTFCIPSISSSSPSLSSLSSSSSTALSSTGAKSTKKAREQQQPTFTTTSGKTITHKTSVVKNNGFNPIWEEKLRIPFECASTISDDGSEVDDMLDLVFVRFVVRQEGQREDAEPLAMCCISLGDLQEGYRHLPLYDAQLSQYLFSTLFVRINHY